ncbi:FAD-dependent monooxygenase [Streptomyces sp. NPDC058326]|uniref:FAD-dependent monooxygenase n=1 Tax=Streptomyces sp. NPDC058326 TaxID=3346447 RepID=UPI0036E13504
MEPEPTPEPGYDAEVIVVGAGPAGLTLAGELRLAGVDVTVVEKLPEPTGQSRGLGFTARTMEVFDQRGLLSRFGEVETSVHGHFGGLPLDFGVVEGAHYGAKNVPQARTEAMLAEWADDLGVTILRGREVTGLTSSDDRVEITVRDTGSGEERVLRAPYLVGCDGGRSTVRKLAGFDFPGTASTMEMFLADVRDVTLRPRMIGETVAGGMVMSGDIGDGVTRIIVCERGTPPQRRTEAPAWSEVAAAWQRLTGEDIQHATPVWVSAFGDATRQVSEYRRGRVLLAGDAAHIHLPAGGQGMNTSIQDAANLGWKLAAEVRGWAPPGLLDSYHDERHPVGVRLLMNTRAQGLLFLSGSEMQPLREVLTELMRYKEVSAHLVGMVSGLEIRYDVGGDPADPVTGLRLPDHRLVGVDGTTTAFELLHTGKGLLLDYSDDAAAREAAAGYADRLTVYTGKPDGLSEGHPLTGAGTLLVRPDGHVAWAGDDPAGLTDALTRWFGAPAAP